MPVKMLTRQESEVHYRGTGVHQHHTGTGASEHRSLGAGDPGVPGSSADIVLAARFSIWEKSSPGDAFIYMVANYMNFPVVPEGLLVTLQATLNVSEHQLAHISI